MLKRKTQVYIIHRINLHNTVPKSIECFMVNFTEDLHSQIKKITPTNQHW